jgi:hypothetical protein
MDATPLLGVSYRQAKRLVARFRADGRAGLVHRGLGRRSNRRTPDAYRKQVLGLIRTQYGGASERGVGQRYGPTLVAEHLWLDHGLLVTVPTLTRWMRGAELWSRARRARPRHQRRERKAHFGELVQLDGSFHAWYEDRGPHACMMSMVDDATGRTLLRFGAEETTWAAAGLLQRWIAAYGVPRAIYTDWKTVYLRTPTTNELARGEAPLTQFGRMCAKLDIELIGATSAQAKGRVERGHGTHQDRLIKKLRLTGAADHAAANGFLDTEYLKGHNDRFAVEPASPVDHHRTRDRQGWPDADVFCLETKRQVGNDHVVQYDHRALQLDRGVRGRVPVKSRVIVRETEDGTVQVVHVGPSGRERHLAWSTAAPRAAKRATVAKVAMVATGSAKPWVPAPDHPWRVQHGRWIEKAAERKAKRAERSAKGPGLHSGRAAALSLPER